MGVSHDAGLSRCRLLSRFVYALAGLVVILSEAKNLSQYGLSLYLPPPSFIVAVSPFISKVVPNGLDASASRSRIK
jgi:hypothetical protein